MRMWRSYPHGNTSFPPRLADRQRLGKAPPGQTSFFASEDSPTLRKFLPIARPPICRAFWQSEPSAGVSLLGYSALLKPDTSWA